MADTSSDRHAENDRVKTMLDRARAMPSTHRCCPRCGGIMRQRAAPGAICQPCLRNTCACGHRRRDHRIEGAPGAPLEDTRWFECEVCECDQFDGTMSDG